MRVLLGGAGLRVSLILLVAASLCHGFCQTREPEPRPAGVTASDSLIYEAFLREVAHSRPDSAPPPAPENPTLNGEPYSGQSVIISFTQPSLLEIGLTDAHLTILKAIAADCDTKSAELDRTARDLVFEARLAAIAASGVATTISERTRELEERRRTMVEDCVRRLRVALEEVAFQKLDTYVHSYANCQEPTKTVRDGVLLVNRLCDSIHRGGQSK